MLCDCRWKPAIVTIKVWDEDAKVGLRQVPALVHDNAPGLCINSPCPNKPLDVYCCNVTHIPSGMSLINALPLNQAKRAVFYLAQKSASLGRSFDESGEQIRSWVDQLTHEARYYAYGIPVKQNEEVTPCSASG